MSGGFLLLNQEWGALSPQPLWDVDVRGAQRQFTLRENDLFLLLDLNGLISTLVASVYLVGGLNIHPSPNYEQFHVLPAFLKLLGSGGLVFIG